MARYPHYAPFGFVAVALVVLWSVILWSSGSPLAAPRVSIVSLAAAGDSAGVEAALAAGVDPNTVESDTTALEAAAVNGHTSVLRLLLENGARLDGLVGGSHRDMAIEYALANAQEEAAVTLLRYGARADAASEAFVLKDVSASSFSIDRCWRGSNRLVAAVACGKRGILEAFLSRGVDPNKRLVLLSMSTGGSGSPWLLYNQYGSNPIPISGYQPAPETWSTPMQMARDLGLWETVSILEHWPRDGVLCYLRDRVFTPDSVPPFTHVVVPVSPDSLYATLEAIRGGVTSLDPRLAEAQLALAVLVAHGADAFLITRRANYASAYDLMAHCEGLLRFGSQGYTRDVEAIPACLRASANGAPASGNVDDSGRLSFSPGGVSLEAPSASWHWVRNDSTTYTAVRRDGREVISAFVSPAFPSASDIRISAATASQTYSYARISHRSFEDDGEVVFVLGCEQYGAPLDAVMRCSITRIDRSLSTIFMTIYAGFANDGTLVGLVKYTGSRSINEDASDVEGMIGSIRSG